MAPAQPASAAAPQQTYVVRRVTALPATTLLHADPATLVDGRRQEIAKTLAVYRQTLYLFWALSQIVAFYYLWRSGAAAAVRDWLRRRLRKRFAVRIGYGFALAATAGLAAFPASAAQYRVAVVFDQIAQGFWSWLGEAILRVAIDGVVLGLIVAAVLALFERTRAWWLYAIVGIFLVSALNGLLAPFVLAPLFNHYAPIEGPAAARYAAFERAAGVDVPIWHFDASRQTQLPAAGVLGIGPQMRIVLGDTLFASLTAGEVEFAVARQIAHVARHDPLRTTIVWTVLFVLSVAAGVLVAERIGFRRDDDPLTRLALVGALAGLAGLLAFPAYNVYSRQIEDKADAYALHLTHDPASLVRALVRSADLRFVNLCGENWANFYFLTTPPLGTRIAEATGRPDPCR